MKEWDKLNLFYHVARAESFTRAAEELNMTQPALSRSIKFLEDRIKNKLFERTAKGVILTREGQILYKHAAKIFAEVDAAMKFIDGKEDSAKGELKILTTHGLSYSWLVHFMKGYLEKFPDINPTIIGSDNYINDGSKINNDRQEFSNFDVAIIPYLQDRPDLIQRYLETFHLKLCKSKISQ